MLCIGNKFCLLWVGMDSRLHAEVLFSGDESNKNDVLKILGSGMDLVRFLYIFRRLSGEIYTNIILDIKI